MIDIEVEKLANAFIQKYSFPLDTNNPYKLNLTLHSVSILDFILNFNFFPNRAQNIEEEILEASAYIGLTLHRTYFMSNPHLSLDLTLSELPKKEVKLSIKGLPNEIKEVSIIKFTSLTNSIFVEKLGKIESLKNEVLHPGLASRPVYPVVLGLALGYSSYIEGPLKAVTQTELSPHFNSTFKVVEEEIENLIKSTSPVLNELDLSSIVNPALIGPPFGYQEKHFAERSFSTLVSQLNKSDLNEEQKEQFARALLRMPDQHLSTLGYLLVTSGSQQSKSLAELGEFSMSYPLAVCSLRGIYRYLRKNNGGESWEHYLASQNIPKAWEELDIEVSCGLLPFIYSYDNAEVLNNDHFLFYDLLAFGRIADALKFANNINIEQPSTTFLLNVCIHNIFSTNIGAAKNNLEALTGTIKDEVLQVEVTNCLQYLIASIENNVEKLSLHEFTPISIPTLWNLNYLYLKAYIEDRLRMNLGLSLRETPKTEEEGLSCLSEFYNFNLSGETTRENIIKFSASAYNYWLEVSKSKS